ncbi:hypothetical protein F7734_56190 [Scytonema sp. UIC 10036]|uniref:hypothetical protein n=1 Tax=Scytonema sp. UIC 10036 TaxID=2304196 RepID=UPI0012DA0B8C|nr:hypothetical protein [Scytonema sp. UIC 10036]MUH01118.1 hypothetical protein [Scytonema sp. UIC 10036]
MIPPRPATTPAHPRPYLTRAISSCDVTGDRIWGDLPDRNHERGIHQVSNQTTLQTPSERLLESLSSLFGWSLDGLGI